MSRTRMMADSALRELVNEMPKNVTVHYDDCGPYRGAMTHYSFGPSQIPASHLAAELNAVLDELAELRAKLKAGREEMLTDMVAVLKREIGRGAL